MTTSSQKRTSQKRTYTIPEFARLMGHSRDSYYAEINRARAHGEQPTLFGIPVIEGPGRLVVSRAKVDRLLDDPPLTTPKRHFR